MATNKRKDAAALFELIDKSTLKVPKSGSLKIPNWWTSKSNPQTEGEAAQNGPGVAPGTGLPPGNGHQVRVASVAGTGTASTVAPGGAATGESGSQSRFLEPARALSGPGASPSIRPPGASIRPPVSPTVKAPPPAAVKTTAPEVAAVVPLAGTGGRSGVVAPQMAPRGNWGPPKPGAFARLPTWVLVSMIAGAIVVASLLILVLQHRHGLSSGQSGTASGGAGHETAPTAVKPLPVQSLIPPMNGDASATPHMGTANPAPTNGNQNPTPAPAETTGHFTGPGTVDRNTDAMLARNGGKKLYYIIIASSPAEDVARRNGEFVAAHGIDASLETQIIENKRWFVLVTNDGFASYDAAEPFRKKIVQIGHELPAYKKNRDGRQAYDTARITNSVKTVAQDAGKG